MKTDLHKEVLAQFPPYSLLSSRRISYLQPFNWHHCAARESLWPKQLKQQMLILSRKEQKVFAPFLKRKSNFWSSWCMRPETCFLFFSSLLFSSYGILLCVYIFLLFLLSGVFMLFFFAIHTHLPIELCLVSVKMENTVLDSSCADAMHREPVSMPASHDAVHRTWTSEIHTITFTACSPHIPLSPPCPSLAAYCLQKDKMPNHKTDNKH